MRCWVAACTPQQGKALGNVVACCGNPIAPSKSGPLQHSGVATSTSTPSFPSYCSRQEPAPDCKAVAKSLHAKHWEHRPHSRSPPCNASRATTRKQRTWCAGYTAARQSEQGTWHLLIPPGAWRLQAHRHLAWPDRATAKEPPQVQTAAFGLHRQTLECSRCRRLRAACPGAQLPVHSPALLPNPAAPQPPPQHRAHACAVPRLGELAADGVTHPPL